MNDCFTVSKSLCGRLVGRTIPLVAMTQYQRAPSCPPPASSESSWTLFWCGPTHRINAVWDAWIDPPNTPARATVEATLAAPQYLVEIMAIAAR